MRIGVLSDTHDRAATVMAALELFRKRDVELVLHCGDIDSEETVRLFAGWPTHFVFGNWDKDWICATDRDDSRLRHAIQEIGGTLHEPWGYLELCGHEIAWIHGDDRALLRDLEYADCFDYLFY